MGCWGITAFESDAGLDAVSFIRKNLPEDGTLELRQIIEALQNEDCRVYAVTDGASHTGPMALAEIVINFIDQDHDRLDYDDEWAAEENKFSSIISFTADKESIKWLRDYISDTLKYSRENAESSVEGTSARWGGWFEEKNWIGWQNHMSTLINRLDELLDAPDSQIELVHPQEQVSGPIMG